jgi:hypothetical protein
MLPRNKYCSFSSCLAKAASCKLSSTNQKIYVELVDITRDEPLSCPPSHFSSITGKRHTAGAFHAVSEKPAGFFRQCRERSMIPSNPIYNQGLK